MKYKLNFIAAAAIAVVSGLALPSASLAARIIKPIVGGPFDPAVNNLGTIMAIRLSQANIYDFTFTIAGLGSALNQIQTSVTGPPAISEPIEFSLYAGSPGTGAFIDQSSFAIAPALTDSLMPGNYYLEILPAQIAVDKELLTGGLALSVPEPASWALMMIGFGAVGVSARNRRRRHNLATA